MNVLKKLQKTNASAEIWWDSSPLIWEEWCQSVMERAKDDVTRKRWANELNVFFDFDNVDKSLIRGITTNPSLIAKSIIDYPDTWRHEIKNQVRYLSNANIETVYWSIYQNAICKAATFMMPMWKKTDGQYGWVSAQPDPRHMFDTDRMMEQALQLARLSPNIMIKVPGSRQGYAVIRKLTARGISTNNTFSFMISQFIACGEAIRQGLEEAYHQGIDTKRWRSVTTFMIGRLGRQNDFMHEAKRRGITLSQTDIRWAEVAILKKAQRLINKKKYPTKMLLSSLMTDDKSKGMKGLSMHLEKTAGENVVYTCKPAFIEDLMARESELPELSPRGTDNEIPEDILEKLLKIPYFLNAYEENGTNIDNFANHAAFVSTYAEVCSNTRKLLDFIAYHIQIELEANTPDVNPEFEKVSSYA